MLCEIFFRSLFLIVLAVVSRAQADLSEFISIDCGIADGSNYTDSVTGMLYRSDIGFVNSGTSETVAPSYTTNSFLVQQFLNLRSFPQGTRNCYTLRPSNGKNYKYLIRLRFLYGNYDRLNRLPQFDVHLGVEYWDTVTINKEDELRRLEMIHIPTSDYMNVCFINTGSGTPFVSVLELRPLPGNIYQTKSGSLDYYLRYDLGSTADFILRYPDDIYDRIWIAKEIENTTILSTASTIESNTVYKAPSDVLRTAITPQNANESLTLSWPTTPTTLFYIYTYSPEVEVLQPNQTISFNMYLNDKLWYGPAYPNDPTRSSIQSNEPESCGTSATTCIFQLIRTESSTLPPIINAFEVYRLVNFTERETNENDVEGLLGIRSAYNVTRNWQGDPCAPQGYVWDGVNCSYNNFNPPRIISLDLSSSSLTGWIALPIYDLKSLESLDLSNNNLTGQVPEFLSQMTSLRVLRLHGNNFTLPIPAQLIDRSRNGLLTLSIDGLENTNHCQSNLCGRRRINSIPPIVPIVASVIGGSLVLLAVGLILWWIFMKQKKQENKDEGKLLATKNRQFTYSEVRNITNDFEKEIGKGGFGTVYHGHVGDTQVAVKMLSSSSSQGSKEFEAEASLLMSVYHKNLSTLVGYCNEGTNMGIIYEYMANGNLDQHLSGDPGRGRNLHTLGWKERLIIANDAAQGLEYLHHSCKPPIVHRDVKSSNILLNEKFEAKLTDFGLSRAFSTEGDSHVSTVVAGTPGYLDPEYYSSSRLTEKSDVYGFGVVLLEIITGRPAIAKDAERMHITQWVSTRIDNGDVSDIVDPKLEGDFEINTAWKIVELAMGCASSVSSERPTMKDVMLILNECLTQYEQVKNKESIPVMSVSGLVPGAR